MNLALWIVQIAVGIKLLSVVVTHGFLHNMPKMKGAMQKMGTPAKPMLAAGAFLLFLGVAGMILPAALKWNTRLVPWSAAFLALMMLLSIFPHQKYRGRPNIVADIILFVLCAFVAYGRWVLAPL